MSIEKVKQCPLEETYLFTTTCSVKSCKLYSPTTDSKCLGIDEVLSKEDKNITDADLLNYKFFDTEMNLKDVSSLRKKAIDRVKNIVALYRLISSLKEKHHDSEGFDYVDGRIKLIDHILERKPLSISCIGFEPWMFSFIVDENYVTSICGPKFKIKTALLLKAKEYAELINVVSSNTIPNKTV